MNSFFSKQWKLIQEWFGKTTFKGSPSLLHKKVLTQPICTILCVDDDRSFCLFMQQLAYTSNIRLDTVYSIQEAKDVIEKEGHLYNAFIIDGHLPDGSGFELVAWIREKKELELPIGFISRIYHDATSFRTLKESLRVNYVLEKPLRPTEVYQLFVQICHLISPQTLLQKPFSDDVLTDLKISYEKTISDKIERLEKMILDVQKDQSIENLKILKGEVHKIAGSAGSYGYMAVSELCKNLELELAKQIDLAKHGKLSQQWFASLDDFFTQIKLHFQIKIPEIESQSLHKSGLLPSVYLVDEDRDFLNHFNRLTEGLNFEISVESRPDHALQTLSESDLYPQIILVNAHYHSSSLTGNEFVKAFYRENDELTNHIALMVEAQAQEEQIKAFQKGMSVVIAKPFSPSFILPLLSQMPFRALPLHYKVLVIDGDFDICQYIVQTLKYTDLEVQVLSDFIDLERTIQSYQPDLILLDINFKDSSGVKILDRLRTEWNYQNMLIGVLALTQQESHLLQQCYDANVDDILFKPLEEGVLQRKIAFLLKNKTNQTLSIKNNPKIGLESVETFKDYLNAFGHSASESFPKMLVMFEIDGLMSVNSQVQEEVIKWISQAFEDLLRKQEMATYLERGRFALVFQGYDPHFVQLFMRHFLLHIYSHLKDNFIKKSFSLYEALVLLSKGEEASNILQLGTELLLLAQQKSNQEPVYLMMDPSFVAPKEVWIVNDETQSLNFLIALFQKHRFKVTSLSALENLPETAASSSLPLLIFAGSAEIKKLHGLRKLMGQNQVQIPILHLPFVPNQDYLERFLHELNYFESPFGLIILFTSGH